MRKLPIQTLGVLFLVTLFQTPITRAQATATATQQLALSAFGGGSGTYTGLYGGRNLGLTAGADLAFMTYHRFRPVLEIRGTYPIHNGQIDAQKDFLGGLKVERDFGRFHAYVNFLVGRGQINYQRNGLQVGTILFLSSTSTVLSPGVGLDLDLNSRWAIKGDFQYQHWNVPFAILNGAPAPVTIVPTLGGSLQAVTTGTITPRVITVGAVYRFDFNHPYRRSRRVR